MLSTTTAKPAEPPVIVRNPAMQRMYECARRVASASLPVLITGETGSGKELVAQTLHQSGNRAKGPFVALNCGALPATLIESVLFGHVRGAFTGAERNASGAFQQADGGTLFLDEIGELTLPAQVALLRALETGCVRPLGASHEVHVDVRIVAATNRDLEKMVDQGHFRRDLLHRIDALQLRLPPLRERQDEIEPLAMAFLERAVKVAGADCPRGIDACAMQRLRAYAWPGNVRELRNAIESAAALCEGQLIGENDLPYRVREALCNARVAESGVAPRPAPALTYAARAERSEPQVFDEAGPSTGDYRSRLRAYETQLLLDGLRRAGGNQCRAAELLDIPRRTLCRRIKELGIRGFRFAEIGEAATA